MLRELPCIEDIDYVTYCESNFAIKCDPLLQLRRVIAIKQSCHVLHLYFESKRKNLASNFHGTEWVWLWSKDGKSKNC